MTQLEKDVGSDTVAAAETGRSSAVETANNRAPAEPADHGSSAQSSSRRLSRLIPARTATRVSAGLLVIQAALFIFSVPWNSVTFDEVQHVPAGISYWHHGRFFSYHHNPPVTKLLFSLPAVMTNVPVEYSQYYYVPGSRHTDFLFGHDFTRVNRDNYQSVFVRCRLVSAALAVLGGWVIFLWSREMFDERAALLSQALWTFSPAVLAHGGLATPDIGATVVGLIATYFFWRYLRAPSQVRVVVSAVALGLAIGSKYTLVVLPPIWGLLALLAFSRRTEEQARQWTLRVFCLDAMVMLFVSLTTLNTVYLYEGTGIPLGRHKLFSNALTVPIDPEDPDSPRVNRFQHEAWKWIPTPFPEHFVLGIDHQMLDSGPGEKYLRGEWRRGQGWWYYYLYALLVKTPLGTLALALLALAGLVGKLVARGRAWKLARAPADDEGSGPSTRAVSRETPDLVDWLTLALPTLVLLSLLSANTELNKHSRYILQIYPFLFVLLGILARAGQGWRSRAQQVFIVACVAVNAVSVLLVHPYYLTYFNEASGGASNGYTHLVDSNVDWGQGLVALKHWLEQHSIENEVQLAYFGAVDPGVYGIEFELPGVLEGTESDTPRPGLHVISVNYVAGSSFSPIHSSGRRRSIPEHGYQFYEKLEPKTTIANCFKVYEVSAEQIDWLLAGAEGSPPTPQHAAESAE